MKTQAYGWLAAAVLALGLNGFYHDGGLGWAHRAADQLKEGSATVLAIATGHVDQFLAEAQMTNLRPQIGSSRLDSAIAVVQASVAQGESGIADLGKMSAQQEASRARLERSCARIEAARARMEARIAARSALANVVVPVSVRVPVVCPRVRVMNIPVFSRVLVRPMRAPLIRIPTPTTGPV